ncbi:MAG: T9SS type A sorting domain-containing protein [Bacteroidia bacterium]
MSWNVLNYPDPSAISSDTSFRNPYFREVVQYINPDIFVIEELATTNGYLLFLNNVMNVAGIGQYSAGTFINGPDTDNDIYYRTSDFQFISNNPIQTALRDINEFTLVHNATSDTIRIYACHLKASSGIINEAQRAAEVDSLRKVTNALPVGSDFIVCGDFNLYGEYEQAYYNLTVDNVTDDGNFNDMLNIPGIWNQPLYSEYHTQSTRFTSIGGGAPGGMNDRFDMILYSNGIEQPGRITYISNSFTNIGNDGMHYNQSINVMPNTAVPQNIADALYNTSDHLPVYADFEFAPTGINEYPSGNSQLQIFPNPTSGNISIHYFLPRESEVNIRIYNFMGELVNEFHEGKKAKGNNNKELADINHLKPGVYFISLSAGEMFLSKKVVITAD